MNKKSYFSKGFTLIELLVVVGILAVLAVAALIAINPLEAQRRSRDSARLQDMARLSGTIEAYLNDEGTTAVPASATSAGEGRIRSQNCANNWLSATANFCPYIKQIPLDPLNSRPDVSVHTQNSDLTRTTVTAGYGFAYSTATGNYVFCTPLEADKNDELIENDGGTAAALFETGPGVGAIACAI